MSNSNLENIKSELEPIGSKITKPQKLSKIKVTGVTSQLSDDECQSGHQLDIKGNDGLSLLKSMLGVVFFFTLFEHLAVRRFSGKTKITRVEKMAIRHPRLYKWCLRCDFIVRGVVVILLILATGWLVHKAVK